MRLERERFLRPPLRLARVVPWARSAPRSVDDRVEWDIQWRPVAAGRWSWGQPGPGSAGCGWEQPRQRRDGSAKAIAPLSRSRREGASASACTWLARPAGWLAWSAS